MTLNPETFVGFVPQPNADPIQVQAKHLLVEYYDVLAGRANACKTLTAIEMLAEVQGNDDIKVMAQNALNDLTRNGAWIDAVHTILGDGSGKCC
jgi:hypothetical protein